eukprot:2965035-Heterocapsa_arctica.AAC.1
MPKAAALSPALGSPKSIACGVDCDPVHCPESDRFVDWANPAIHYVSQASEHFDVNEPHAFPEILEPLLRGQMPKHMALGMEEAVRVVLVGGNAHQASVIVSAPHQCVELVIGRGSRSDLPACVPWAWPEGNCPPGQRCGQRAKERADSTKVRPVFGVELNMAVQVVEDPEALEADFTGWCSS